MLTQELVKELFDYIPETGDLVWKKLEHQSSNFKKAKIGGKAGSKRNDGYVRIGIGSKCYFAHRVVFLYHNGHLPKYIDHKNQIKSDNRIENLRAATVSLNTANMTKTKRNTTGFKGAYKHTGSKGWYSQIRVNNRNVHLGCFFDLIEAAKAYDKAALEYFGEFACLNFPQDKQTNIV
jgi:hypothetical protein